MKEKLSVNDYKKQLLNQRNLIETVFDYLKNKYHIWHTHVIDQYLMLWLI
jgi:hypothetical protein